MSATITLTVNPRDRITLTTTIERLINLLDEMEPDPDLEPWLGRPERINQGVGLSGARDDREHDTDTDEGDGDVDKEYSLGWTEKCSQGHDAAARLGYPSTRGCDVVDEIAPWEQMFTGDGTREAETMLDRIPELVTNRHFGRLS